MKIDASGPDLQLDEFRLAAGFRASATACGLKPSGNPDLALIVADRPCAAAGVFTRNRVQAAPVLHDRDTLARNAAGIRAVVANSGCANACTGERGRADAARMAELAGEYAGVGADTVLVLSTGVIGVPLDMAKLARGIASLPAPDANRAGSAARAMMTTDTRPKVAGATARIGGREVRVAGIAKGAGMIHPDMATLLAVVTTDARIAPADLDQALRAVVDRSFNRISVDGDTSTNDTVLLLASGASGVAIDPGSRAEFDRALLEVTASLARQVARDGEGATRLIEVEVCGAASEAQAHRVANRIACSLLVKTAIHGGDPNWGRILAAAGSSGEPVDPALLSLVLGSGAKTTTLVEGGAPRPFDAAAAAALLREDPVTIRLGLGLGTAQAAVWTCDLSAEYVSINADYTT